MAITVKIVREQKIPTMMITHNMGQALSVGNRTIMMDAGQIILDIAGDERAEMTVPKLMTMYSGARGKELDNDRMLLSQ
jgi:putative ABC transport system ATP-binding protein